MQKNPFERQLAKIPPESDTVTLYYSNISKQGEYSDTVFGDVLTVQTFKAGKKYLDIDLQHFFDMFEFVEFAPFSEVPTFREK